MINLKFYFCLKFYLNHFISLFKVLFKEIQEQKNIYNLSKMKKNILGTKKIRHKRI